MEKQLAQARPSGTSAVSIYSPGVGVTATIATINICNTTASSTTYRIFLDNDGTTYDENTAHYWDVIIKKNQTQEYRIFWVIDNSAGNLAVRTATGNALTFSVYGLERTS